MRGGPDSCAGCGVELDVEPYRLVVLRAVVQEDGFTRYERRVEPERYCSRECAQAVAEELRTPCEVRALVLPEKEAEGTDRTAVWVPPRRPPFVAEEFPEFFDPAMLNEPPPWWEPEVEVEEEDSDG